MVLYVLPVHRYVQTVNNLFVLVEKCLAVQARVKLAAVLYQLSMVVAGVARL